MRKLNLLTLVASAAILFACNNQSSEKTATEEFADLSKQEEFVEKHDEPKEISPELIGTMIELPIENEASGRAYWKKSETESNHYLFVIHEWWGLNEHIKQEADRLYQELGNVNIVALDLYDGNVATTREKAMEYMQGADEARIQKIIAAAIKMAGEEAKIATIGWCFGGGWSLRTALQAGNQTEACVMYYGMPVEDVETLKGLNSDALFIYGSQDQWINKEVADKFAANMKAVGKDVEIIAFDADHAFANPSSEHFIEAAAQEANKKALAYLKSRIGA